MFKKRLSKPGHEITKTLAENLVTFRKKNNISQEDLADRCDFHRTYIGSIERGERNVTLSTLEILANVIGVSVPMLLTSTKNPTK